VSSAAILARLNGPAIHATITEEGVSIMATGNIQLDRFLASVRAEGFEVMRNWEAPRWTGDKHTVIHYSVIDAPNGRRPAVRTFLAIDFEGNGYALYTEAPNSKIEDDVRLIVGTAD
jgi:hypothetical protein